METVLAQLALEVFRAYTKAKAAAAAEGHDLDALLAGAAADNAVSIWDVLKIKSPVGDVPPPSTGFAYNILTEFPIAGDDTLKANGAQAGDQVGTGSLEIGDRWEVAQKGKIFWHNGITYLRTIQ